MALDQTAFRFGINELAESTHGWHAAQNVNPTVGTGQTIDLDTTFLLRFGVQASGGVAHSNIDLQFQYNKNNTTWTNITTSSSNVKAVSTTVFTDQSSPTQRITGLTGTFESSSQTCTHDGNTGGAQNDILANGNCETECALQFVGADLNSGDAIQFRLLQETAVMTTYTQIPLVIVLKPLSVNVGTYSQVGYGGGIAPNVPAGLRGLMGRPGPGPIGIATFNDPFDPATLSLQSTLQAIVMPAEFGSYALNGQTVNLIQARKIAADQGSFALNGQTTTLTKGFTVSAAQGSFALNGQNVLFQRTYNVPANQGSFNLNGQTVNLLQGYKVTADQGSFALNGQNVNLLSGHRLIAGEGNYALNGQNVSLLTQKLLQANFGAFALNGQTVNLRFDHVVSIGQGSFNLNGQSVTLIWSGSSPTIAANQGAFTLNGQTVNLLWARTPLAANHGSFSLNGQDVTLKFGRSLPASQGSFTLNGQSVNFQLAHKILADQGAFALNGQDINFLFTHRLPANFGLFLLNGQTVLFVYSGQVDIGTVTILEALAHTLTVTETQIGGSATLSDEKVGNLTVTET